MQELAGRKGERVHTRSIRIDTFAVDDDQVIVEGALEDTRHLVSFSLARKVRPPARIHGMVVRLLIGGMPARIVKAEAEMPEVPLEECRVAMQSVKKLEGMSIVYGFSKEVKDRLDGVEGCSHLTSLVLTMGSAAVQGMAAHQARKPPVPEMGAGMLEYLKNTCCTWREDGPAYRRVLEEVRAALETAGVADETV
jgi:hypothetical protein